MAKFVAVMLLVLLGANTALAGEPRRLVVFGDSLSDPGNAFVLLGETARRPFDLIPSAPYARGGLHFSNGATWVEQLARRGSWKGAGPALRAPGAFSNYAVGGARARVAGGFDLPDQLALYLSHGGGQADADALHVLFLGGNDLRDALVALQADPSGAASAAILGEALASLSDAVVALASAGARDFLIANAPDIGQIPAVRLQGPLAQAGASFLSLQFNQGLAATLDGLEAALPIRVRRLDVAALFAAIIADPAGFGFSDAENSCITPGVRAHAVCRHPRRYLFWDGAHPTDAAHNRLASAALKVIESH